jgi:hypothetical protein
MKNDTMIYNESTELEITDLAIVSGGGFLDVVEGVLSIPGRIPEEAEKIWDVILDLF